MQATTGVRRHPRPRTAAVAAIAATVTLAVALASSAQAAPVAVPLATADSFAILAGAGITNTGSTTVTGDIGTSPTASFTGAGSITHAGAVHAADDVADQAKTDLVTAYDNAAGQGPVMAVPNELGGLTLTSGVYSSGDALGLTGTLTLDGDGDPNAVWVFQTPSTLITATDSAVVLIDGAQACNVYWQVGSSTTLGTRTSFVGTVMALTSITLTTGATVAGRVLARNGAVTLDSNTIIRPLCAVPTPSASASASATASPTVVPSEGATPAPSAGAGVGATAGPGTGSGAGSGSAARRGPQVPQVPTGGVSTGDGSSVGAGTTGAVVLALLGAAAVIVAGTSRLRTRRSRAE
ncbi:ice-binding family protein [Cellulomonas sp. S1-8]|uniref:ice-binding family protein n=1 Tax=Cellulomonas sp. S1-8 TaxID=2904790 RepID=UPI0022442D47|nr:ice-binding family protein [Cellulomonas sp. S1-8]UZN04786.1 ice-binding family protein [Cellulomonas sp. S1-8]